MIAVFPTDSKGCDIYGSELGNLMDIGHSLSRLELLALGWTGHCIHTVVCLGELCVLSVLEILSASGVTMSFGKEHQDSALEWKALVCPAPESFREMRGRHRQKQGGSAFLAEPQLGMEGCPSRAHRPLKARGNGRFLQDRGERRRLTGPACTGHGTVTGEG